MSENMATSTALVSICSELKAISAVLSSLWHSKYFNEETDQISPAFLADEYISVEECAKRLSLSQQTLRNWILKGKTKAKSHNNTWKQGIHYILIPGGAKGRHIIRIPWNQLIRNFSRGPDANMRTFDKTNKLLYKDIDRDITTRYEK